jgi:hypothetical protein
MDQRLSDTPEDEAARAKKKSEARAPKQARARKSASSEASNVTKPSARKRASGSAESSPAKPAARKPRATNARRRENAQEKSVAGLAAQGFSEGEAARLLEVSERAAYSTEARESEAVMNRLRFTRWLVERGLINEFAV